MTDDIVARLRVGIHTSVDPLALTNEAADRIEALEAALREKDNIAYIIDSHGMTHQSFTIVYSAALEGERPMTDDIVARLRGPYEWLTCGQFQHTDLATGDDAPFEAADEIERLRADLAQARAALAGEKAND